MSSALKIESSVGVALEVQSFPEVAGPLWWWPDEQEAKGSSDWAANSHLHCCIQSCVLLETDTFLV